MGQRGHGGRWLRPGGAVREQQHTRAAGHVGGEDRARWRPPGPARRARAPPAARAAPPNREARRGGASPAGPRRGRCGTRGRARPGSAAGGGQVRSPPGRARPRRAGASGPTGARRAPSRATSPSQPAASSGGRASTVRTRSLIAYRTAAEERQVPCRGGDGRRGEHARADQARDRHRPPRRQAPAPPAGQTAGTAEAPPRGRSPGSSAATGTRVPPRTRRQGRQAAGPSRFGANSSRKRRGASASAAMARAAGPRVPRTVSGKATSSGTRTGAASATAARA